MKEFNKLCIDFEKMNPTEYRTFFYTKIDEIVPILAQVKIDNIPGLEIFSSFIIGAIVADGKFDFDEYLLVLPLLNKFVGLMISFKKASELFELYKKDKEKLKNTAIRMINLFDKISVNLKYDIIIICMMICAVDGKISRKEKKWIMQLIK